MGKQNIKAEILSQKKLSADIFDMTLNVGDMAREAVPGQFVSVYVNDGSKLCRDRSVSVVLKENRAQSGLYTGLRAGERNF